MPTERTTIRRHPERAVYDRAVVHAVVDEARVCHVAFVDGDGAPTVIPTGHVRMGDEVFLHGHAANHALLSLAAGGTVCVAFTLLDGLVLSRAAKTHSMNYRSVVAFGAARVVEGEEKARALHAFVEGFLPGRAAEVRAPSEAELRSTLVVAVSIAEASAKVRTGGPGDYPHDVHPDEWAGEVPLRTVVGAPVAHESVAPGTPLPASVEALLSRSEPAAPDRR